jgi:hypothetical protein
VGETAGRIVLFQYTDLFPHLCQAGSGRQPTDTGTNHQHIVGQRKPVGTVSPAYSDGAGLFTHGARIPYNGLLSITIFSTR